MKFRILFIQHNIKEPQKDVYLYQDSADPTVYYYWSEAQTIYLPTSCDKLFYNQSSLTEIDLSELNSSKVTNMRSMFNNCSKLSSLNLSNFNTSNVGSDDVINSNSKKYEGSMYQMFLDCSSLTSLDLSSFDTSNAKTMEKMFEGCTQLHTINFGRSFELSNVTTMEKMFGFAGANNNLTTIYVSDLWSTDSITNDADVFYYCNALVGEKGTSASSSKNTDPNRKKVIYARIDNPPDSPGYFTYRAYPPPASTSSSSTASVFAPFTFIGTENSYHLLC